MRLGPAWLTSAAAAAAAARVAHLRLQLCLQPRYQTRAGVCVRACGRSLGVFVNFDMCARVCVHVGGRKKGKR